MKTIEQRFWEKADKKDLNSCWLWTASSTIGGYGRLRCKRNEKWIVISAHRYSYELHFGSISNEIQVLHTCDTPACVNPDHLFLGTHLDNMTDKRNKKRGLSARGENHSSAKLTENEVIEIRKNYAVGIRQAELAKKYSVAQTLISHIVTRGAWKHVK